MNHFCRHVVESAWTQFHAFAFACQHRFAEIMVCDSLAVCQCLRTWIALDVRISRAVAWVSDRHAESDFGRAFAEIGKNLVPFKIGQVLEDRNIARGIRRFGRLRTRLSQRHYCDREENPNR